MKTQQIQPKRAVSKLVAINVALTCLLGLIVVTRTKPLAATRDIFTGIVAIENNGVWMGSGFFVSPNVIVTAAHVVRVALEPSLPSDNTLVVSRREHPILIGALPLSYDLSYNAHESKSNDPLNLQDFIGKSVGIRWVGWDNIQVTAEVRHIDFDADIAVLKVVDPPCSSPVFYPPVYKELSVGEELTYLGCIGEDPQVIKAKLVVCNPALQLSWSGANLEEGKLQPMIITQFALVGGTSGGVLLNSKGQAVAVHVGGIQRGLSIETSLTKIQQVLTDIIDTALVEVSSED